MDRVGGKNLVINKIGINQTIDYAALELKKYLSLMCRDADIEIKESEKYDASQTHVLWLGEYAIFPDRTFMNVEDAKFDDAISVSVRKGAGIIAGANQRSVLIGAYQFLAACGCRFLRPGTDGEVIPEISIEELNAEISHKPSYRHRGLCIEGAVSYENVFDIIEWSPKVGFNSYFIQFREAYVFFERWYKHKLNPEMQAEEFPVEMARKHVKKIEQEIVKRGMIYHAVGHGWTCEPLGIPGLGWEEENVPVPEETRQYLALVNGKRELWTGVPLYTSLCYSSSKVQELMVESIVEYLKANRAVDILHFWLADGTNNQCECESCKDTRPSDFYVQMLNSLDERLTEENIETKIVFLIYVDLFWPPEKEIIKNQDRFIMMFAPFDRVYDKSFVANENKVSISSYRRNHIDRPSSIPENLAYLEAWQKMFKGDSFDFDYHFMWAHFYDPGYFKIARTLYEDIVNLKNIGLNGFISCQLQRTFMPSGLGMYVMAKTLWDAEIMFEDISEEYFQGSFGEKGIECKEYLEKLSDMFYPSYILEKTSCIDEREASRFHSIIPFINSYEAFMEDSITTEQECHALSFRYLKYHAEIASCYAAILEARALKDKKKVEILWAELRQKVQKGEKNFQRVFDVFEFIDTMDKLLKE